MLDDQLAIQVGVQTAKATDLLHEISNPKVANAVLGEVHPSGYIFEKISDYACRVTYLTCVDTKGNVPHWVAHMISKNDAMAMYHDFSDKFGLYNTTTEQSIRSKRVTTVHSASVTPILSGQAVTLVHN